MTLSFKIFRTHPNQYSHYGITRAKYMRVHCLGERIVCSNCMTVISALSEDWDFTGILFHDKTDAPYYLHLQKGT